MASIPRDSILGFLQHPAITAAFGGVVGYLIEKITRGRKLRTNVLYHGEHECIEKEFHWTVVASICNPNSNTASLYKFAAVSECGKTASIDLDNEMDERLAQREIILMCANDNKPLRAVTYIEGNHVYPLKIAIPLDYKIDDTKVVIKTIEFASRSCGFFKTKFQYFSSNREEKYQIKIPEKMIDNQKPLQTSETNHRGATRD